jgi:excisionase family DNA binding protein
METVFLSLSKNEFQDLISQSVSACLRRQPNIANSREQEEQDSLLTIQQTAQLISLSVPTLYSLVSRSEIPVFKKGKRLYFSKKEITDWIKTGRKKTANEIICETDSFLSTLKQNG